MKIADCPCKNSRLNEILLFYLFCFLWLSAVMQPFQDVFSLIASLPNIPRIDFKVLPRFVVGKIAVFGYADALDIDINTFGWVLPENFKSFFR